MSWRELANLSRTKTALRGGRSRSEKAVLAQDFSNLVEWVSTQVEFNKRSRVTSNPVKQMLLYLGREVYGLPKYHVQKILGASFKLQDKTLEILPATIKEAAEEMLSEYRASQSA